MKTIAIAGTFDSKGKEFLYVKELIEKQGMETLTIHTGVFAPEFEPDVNNAVVAEAAGYDMAAIEEKRDRALAMQALSEGMKVLLPRLYSEGKFDGVISLGGSGGTSLVTPAMQALPVGVPKLMVSTMASGDVSEYVGTSDIVMMPSIVDVSGINTLSEIIYRNAAAAVCGMVNALPEQKTGGQKKRKTVAAMMFGVTTPCVEKAKAVLENAGYEVLVFHATGTGGRTMESLARSGIFAGILDITTTEWCDEIAGGILSAGEHRNEAASLLGIPQVVSVGALDMVNFGPMETVPEKYRDRNLYPHNPMITLMRTNVEENRLIAEKLAEKLSLSSGNAALLLPLGGVSMLDEEGQPFWGPEEDKVLFETLEEKLKGSKVEIMKLNHHINDDEFAETAAKKLIKYMEEKNYE